MISLLLATACGAMLSIVLRISEGRLRNKNAMIAFNYLACMLLAGITIGLGDAEVSYAGMPRTLGLGMVNGLFYASAMVAMQYNIPRNGVVLPAVFSKTGALVVPLVISIFLFREIPGAWQTIGAVLAVAGILLMNYRKGVAAGSVIALFVVLLMEGMASAMSKIYREVGADALSNYFLFFTFLSAFLFSAVLVVREKARFGIREAAFGVLMGVPNFVASRLVLKALETIPAIIVYPFRSVGTIGLVTLAGLFLFRERLSRRQIAALVVILTAMVLLNL